MFITTGVAFFSTRIILNYLGVTDYGIYSLIGGVVAILSFLHMAMAVSTQRYLSYHQGTGDFSMQKKIFSHSWSLHVLIGLTVLFIIELAGLFLFNDFLNIPPERIHAAKILYHLTAASVFFGIISIPFSASLTAHENMTWPSIINIIEAILKLCFAFSLVCFIQQERLVVFGIFILSMSIMSLLLLMGYCLRNYKECCITDYKTDKSLIKELGKYAGLNLFGTISVLGQYEGFGVILNLFLGMIANTAYGIANQVLGALTFFSGTILSAMNPQIMKSEGSNDRDRMLRISMMASKFGFFLLAFLAIPCIFEMPALLKFWLTTVPEYAVIFCTLMLITTMINQLTVGLTSAIQAAGKITSYMLVVGSIKLLILPCTYLLLMSGNSVISVLIGYISLELLADSTRLLILRKIVGLSIKTFFKRVLFKEFFPVFLSVCTCSLIVTAFQFNLRFLVTMTISAIVFIVSAYFTGLCGDEKIIAHHLLKPIFKVMKSKFV
jgi:O-antigen/teichoic acid export membrane protein